MKKAILDLLNRVPVFVVVMGEAVMIYLATAIAKVAFTQLDPLYAVWFRVGFMTLMLLAWRRPWRAAKRAVLPHDARGWAIVAGCGLAVALMNTMFYVAISNMDMGIAVAIEFIGPLSVAVITGRSWRERLGIVIAACGVVLLAGVSLAGANGSHFLIGLIAVLIGGSMWGVYIVLGRQIASRGNSLDNLSVAIGIGWIAQTLFLGPGAIEHVIHPKASATWAAAPGGAWKLLGLLLLIATFASFIPYMTDQIVMRRTTSGAFSVMQSINPAVAVGIGLAFGEIPTVWECVGVALVIVAVIVTFSGDQAPAR
ncbi:EamA family transporter [Bifidobacterium biavatii]|uniref:Threonine/homoserine efflux transporter n=1 Tax=Bifidobacterium biavatii DSM 23969 TaxID=1437608 RepID=A0A086ZRF7_9BIFI|nr:EamA family transporter [Bifidobacterium biavatii]KFI49107.1 threonine/homoserine efflux transporter [Bifidobacterium biavatii DSM 23969]